MYNQATATKRGLVIVNTGNGKGKTTAALGILLRSWGRDMDVGVLQFIKSPDAGYGEYQAATKMGFEIIQFGDGCLWNSDDVKHSQDLAVQAWEKAKEHILSQDYDVLVLDEFTYPLTYKWIDSEDVISWLSENKPPLMHLVITGRYAPRKLIDFADLVTEMKSIKHPFETEGMTGQPGIEF